MYTVQRKVGNSFFLQHFKQCRFRIWNQDSWPLPLPSPHPQQKTQGKRGEYFIMVDPNSRPCIYQEILWHGTDMPVSCDRTFLQPLLTGTETGSVPGIDWNTDRRSDRYETSSVPGKHLNESRDNDRHWDRFRARHRLKHWQMQWQVRDRVCDMQRMNYQMQLKARRQVPCQAENETNPDTMTGTETGSVPGWDWHFQTQLLGQSL